MNILERVLTISRSRLEPPSILDSSLSYSHSLTFTPDSALLISSSADASVHVFVVAHLLDPDTPGTYSQPYGTLGDHTLAITAVAVGRTANANGGRCWTAAEDGTVKVRPLSNAQSDASQMWSLSPPFDLLATFSLPSAAKATSLVVDSAERFLYVGSGEGNVYLIPLSSARVLLGELKRSKATVLEPLPSKRISLVSLVEFVTRNQQWPLS
jgi:pre-rRNA-processing protein IPI3